MKVAYVCIGALAVLLVMMGYCTEQVGKNAAVADRSLRLLDEFAVAESMLHRDILSARAGMLRNYDSLTQEVSAMRSVAARLTAAAEGDAELARAASRLMQRAAAQENWTERFKSSNALLQNSMAFFGVTTGKLSAAGAPESIARQISTVSTAVLHLSLDDSPAAAAALDARLESMQIPEASGEARSLRALQAHGRLLRILLPQTEGVLKSVFVAAGGSEPADFRALLLARRNFAEERAAVFRYVLFGVSLLLALGILGLIRLLRRRAAWLRKRAAIEHDLATISTRFINSRPGEIDAMIRHALCELGVSCSAARTYFIVADKTYRWSDREAPFPDRWPAEFVDVVQSLELASSEAIHISNTSALPVGTARQLLTSAGVRSWLFVRGRVRGQQAALGFDFARRNLFVSRAEFGLLRMAFDAIASAVDRDAMERDRARLEENLRQARRMETVGTFASGIAHNFNNIVGAIVGFTESAQAHLNRDSAVAENLDEIRNAGERARDLVGQILTFGRRTLSRRTPSCLKLLLKEAKSLLDASLPSAVRIAVRASDEIMIIDAEPSQIQQVILNVCNNAAQAMDASGVIAIDLEVRDSPCALRLDCGELAVGRYAVLCIADTGRGMEASVKERIFEPFFTTRSAGNGLGLATVREIVLEHGGALRVKSSPGAGTHFEIWLRCMESAGTSLPKPPRVHSRGHGETILVLELDRERLLRDEEFLAALGYEPVGFTHAAEAVAACHMDPARFDAALICCHSSLSESALLNATSLRRGSPNIPIILATSSARDLDAQDLASAGVAAVVSQPLALSELAETLASHVRNSLQV